MATTKVQSELIVDDVALAGNPTTTTQSAGNNTTRIATTAFVTTAINNLINSAPGTLDTLDEIAAALNDDPSFTTTVNNAIATKLPLAGGTITGTVVFNSAPTFNTAITMGSTLNVASTVGIAGTTVIDSSRNLTNIGTISSGAITSDVSDGTAITLKRSGSTAAKFGVATGPVGFIVLNDTTSDNVAALKGTSRAILPSTNAGADKNGTMSLGSSSAKFKDLHLAGTIASGVINAHGASGGSNLSYASNFKADSANVQITFERGTDSTGWGGIGANGANAFMVYNESTQEKLTLTQGGNLSVTGTIDSANIGVTGASGGNGQISVARTSGATVATQAQSARGLIGTSSNHPFRLMANGTQYVELTTNGDVEVLTGNLSLTAAGSEILVDAYEAQQEGGGIFIREGFQSSNRYNLSIIARSRSNDGSADGLSINGYEGVAISTGSNSYQERMFIHSTISTTVPLSVTGNLSTTGSMTADGAIVGGTTSTPVGDLRLYGTGNNYLKLYGTAGNNFEIDLVGTSATGQLVLNQFDFLVGTGSAVYSGSERMSLSADGTGAGLGIQCITAASQCLGLFNSDSGGTRHFIRFAGGSGGPQVGSVTNVSSTTSYNTTSDYRLKENITYEFNALERLAQLKPARFNFIADGTDRVVDGFIAHEVSDVVPEAVAGEKDAVKDDGTIDPQGMDASKLVPLLTKAIQEQQVIIDDLKTRIEALEG